MHISEGILSGPVCMAGYAGAVAVTAATLRKLDREDIPKVSVVTAAFFIASLIHIKVGPTSTHLILNGLAGILLGAAAFPSILVGLLFQAVMFGHGGITTLGANALSMGVPALTAGLIFRCRSAFHRRWVCLALAFIAGSSAVLFSGLIMAGFLYAGGKEFFTVAKLAILTHIPIMAIEGLLCVLIVGFVMRVKPGLLK